MAEAFLGEIRMVGFTYAPRGWAFCNGQLLPISQNNALFALLGTTYGGDGQYTFGLPDFRGRVPIHPGQSPGTSNRQLGEQGGVENVTLLAQQMPFHSHNVNVSTTEANASSPQGNFNAVSTDPNSLNVVNSYSGSANGNLNPSAISPSGGNQPHENVQPFTCVNFIIALEGIFPSRN